MLFPTFDFLLFALPVLAGYWALGGRPQARILFLLAASYFFYMAGPKTDPPPAAPYYVGLLVFSTMLDFVAGLSIHRQNDALASDDPYESAKAKRIRDRWLWVSLIGNLGLLGYFKYFNFFIEVVTDSLSVLGVHVEGFHLDVVLPLGISFYTFQSLSYTLDIHRQRLAPETSFRRFALFVVFFPQLVAGPIVRASQFLPQLNAGPRFTRANIETGAFRVMKGLAKKVVLGDWIASNFTDRVFDSPGAYTTSELILALYGYTLQLYADFSGYSDIAIGLALMLGYTIPENFDRPYQSRDIAEYWRRWHMTLATWLRDYLFFTLLSKLGARGGYIALGTTMFLVGMWHGASWNFVIFASIHAGAMVFNRWNRARPRNLGWRQNLLRWPPGIALGLSITAVLARWAFELSWDQAWNFAAIAITAFLAVCALPLRPNRYTTLIHILMTFHLVVFSRIFFRAPDLETARQYITGLMALDGYGLREDLAGTMVWVALAFGILFHFTPKNWVDVHMLTAFRKLPAVVMGLGFALLCLGLMKLLEGAPKAFIYFQF